MTNTVFPLMLLVFIQAAQASVRIGTYNIEDGAIGVESQRLAALRGANADIVGIQEANSWTSMKKIADSLGFYVFGPHVENQFTYAPAILSRYPIVDSAWWRANGAYRALTAAAIALPSGDTVGIFSLHLEPLDPTWRQTQLDVYKRKIAEWQGKYRCFVVGDFNSDLSNTLGELNLSVIGGSGIDWITADQVFSPVPGSAHDWGSGGSDHDLQTVDVNIPSNHVLLVPREGAQVLHVAQMASLAFSAGSFVPPRNLTPATTAFRIVKLPSKGVMTLSGTPVDTQRTIFLAQASMLLYSPSADSIGWDVFEWRAFNGTEWSTRRGTVRIIIEGLVSNLTFGTIPWATNTNANGIGWYDYSFARRGSMMYAPYENQTIDSLPGILRGAQYIRNGGACEGPWPSDQVFQQFDLAKPATLFIAIDPMVRIPPGWLTQTFTRSLANVPMGGGRMFDIYQKDFNPGRVTLYGNNFPWSNRNAGLMYVVFAKNNPVRAGIVAFLEGPYDSTIAQMHNGLRIGGALSARFPGLSIPANAIDSIAIELRTGALNPAVRMFCPAWLLRDGTIRHFTDTTKNYVEFDVAAGGYYLVVHHRNHIAIMSSTPVALSPTSASAYDFTTSPTQAYGTNALKQVGTRYLMYAGDVNGSGLITTSDANSVFGSINMSGYIDSDITLKGTVTTESAAMVLRNLCISTQVPP